MPSTKASTAISSSSRNTLSPESASNCSVIALGDKLYTCTSNGQDWTHVNIPNPNAPSLIALDRNTGEFLAEDNAGIGPDISIKAWLHRDELNLPPFYLLGDCDFLKERAKALGLHVELAAADAGDAATAFAKALPVVATGVAATAPPGRPDASSAEAALASIRQAVSDVRTGHAAAIVTNPIAKSVLYRAGFRHPGHTEFLAELAAADGQALQPVMMLWSPVLAVVPVTIHLALREAIERLSTELIVATARITVASLKARFGVVRPRLSISGLNPHAGEDGSLGSEDLGIVTPAVDIL